jgi:hypothetical protein
MLTNLDVSSDEQLAEVEWWYRHRTDIEALNKDGKHGAALRHLPSGDHAVNSVWMWAALLACAISAWLQELTGIDRGNGRGRRTIGRLRHELINIPARLTRRAGTTWLHLPPGEQLLATVLPRLQQLPHPGLNPPSPSLQPEPHGPVEPRSAGATAGQPPYPPRARHPDRSFIRLGSPRLPTRGSGSDRASS